MTGTTMWLNPLLRNRTTIRLSVMTAFFLTVNVCDQVIAEDQAITITSPTPGQVIQRIGFDPQNTANAEPGASAFGHARIEVQGTLPAEMPADTALQYRVVLKDGGHRRHSKCIESSSTPVRQR